MVGWLKPFRTEFCQLIVWYHYHHWLLAGQMRRAIIRERGEGSEGSEGSEGWQTNRDVIPPYSDTQSFHLDHNELLFRKRTHIYLRSNFVVRSWWRSWFTERRSWSRDWQSSPGSSRVSSCPKPALWLLLTGSLGRFLSKNRSMAWTAMEMGRFKGLISDHLWGEGDHVM